MISWIWGYLNRAEFGLIYLNSQAWGYWVSDGFLSFLALQRMPEAVPGCMRCAGTAAGNVVDWATTTAPSLKSIWSTLGSAPPYRPTGSTPSTPRRRRRAEAWRVAAASGASFRPEAAPGAGPPSRSLRCWRLKDRPTSSKLTVGSPHFSFSKPNLPLWCVKLEISALGIKQKTNKGLEWKSTWFYILTQKS